MVSTKQQILDIAMNLHRISGWAASDYDGKEKRIQLFLEQTNDYVKSLEQTAFPEKFIPTMQVFLKKFKILSEEGLKKPTNIEAWTESLMTWGNILTHRAKYLS